MTTEPDRAVVDVLMVEYESLREESIAAIEHRMTATNFTFAALAVIIAGLLSARIDVRLVGVTLVFFVPQLAKAGLLVWLGEYKRSQRAGQHISTIEARVNDLLGLQVLTWEGRLTKDKTHMDYPYRAVMLLLLGTGYAGGLMGLGILFERVGWLPDPGWWIVLVLLGLVAVAWEVWFYGYFIRLWREARGATVPPAPRWRRRKDRPV